MMMVLWGVAHRVLPVTVEAGVRRRLHALRLDAGAMLAAGGVLLVATLWAVRLPARPAVAVCAGAALVWWAFDGAFDGPTLLGVTRTHGVTAADLVPPVCWAVVGLARRRSEVLRDAR